MAKLQHNEILKTVNIGTLKNQLSAYLKWVKNGEEILVRDRNLPVASIVPIDAPGIRDEEACLIATGQLSPAKEKSDWDSFWKLPAGNVPRRAAVEARFGQRAIARAFAI